MKKILIGLLVVMGLINLIAVFGPEIGFDALWYQLTLPKLWLTKQQWFFEGGLLYYSPMPRLGGVLFLVPLKLWGEGGAKMVQFVAGVGSAWIVYKIARIKFTEELSLFAVCCFYITNIVSWQSGSAYVDLIRTFFEISAFYLAISDTKRDWISFRKLFAGVMIGLAIGVKWQAIVTLLMLSVWFSPLIFVVGILVASPWMMVAHHFTGNPLYPIFETFMSQIQLREVGPYFYQPLQILRRVVGVPWQFVSPFDDHTNPALFLVVVALVFCLRSFKDKFDRSILFLCLSGLILWQVIPPPSTRYYLPYLPYLAIAAIYVVTRFTWFRCVLLLSFVLVISMRMKANLKFIPYLVGRETKEEFLVKHVGGVAGTFIDVDRKIQNNLPHDKKYLIDGLTNLYYFPFDYDHTSWAKDYEGYDYLVTNRDPIWEDGMLILENDLGIKVYKKTLE